MSSQRLHAVDGLGDDLDAFDPAEQKTQLVARQLLVVGDHRRQRAVVITRWPAPAARRIGISRWAQAPLPG